MSIEHNSSKRHFPDNPKPSDHVKFLAWGVEDQYTAIGLRRFGDQHNRCSEPFRRSQKQSLQKFTKWSDELEGEDKVYLTQACYRWSKSAIESCLKKLGVPERVAAQKARRAAFTRELKTIRLDNDFGSSGLWDAQGRNLGYDLLDLPFRLVRRIAAWQKDFNDTEFPPSTSDDAWWDRHEREAIDIGKMLQEALGSETVVTLFQGDDWISVDQYERTKE